jgi:hypothetical protein
MLKFALLISATAGSPTLLTRIRAAAVAGVVTVQLCAPSLGVGNDGGPGNFSVSDTLYRHSAGPTRCPPEGPDSRFHPFGAITDAPTADPEICIANIQTLGSS